MASSEYQAPLTYRRMIKCFIRDMLGGAFTELYRLAKLTPAKSKKDLWMPPVTMLIITVGLYWSGIFGWSVYGFGPWEQTKLNKI